MKKLATKIRNLVIFIAAMIMSSGYVYAETAETAAVGMRDAMKDTLNLFGFIVTVIGIVITAIGMIVTSSKEEKREDFMKALPFIVVGSLLIGWGPRIAYMMFF